MNGIILDHWKTGLHCDCLAFADNTEFVAKNLELIRTKLKISFANTEYMIIDTKESNWRTMRSKFDDIEKVQKFNSLGEILTQNINEKEAIEETARSMEAAFRLYQKTCKSKYLSYRVKIRR